MKDLLTRAAELIRGNKATSAELTELMQAVQKRADEVDLEMRAARVDIDSGETVEAIEEAKARLERLQTEDKLLHRRRSELHQERKLALGREAVAQASRLQKRLTEAAKRASAAMAEAESAARALADARVAAREIGQTITADAEVVHELAELLHQPGSAAYDEFCKSLGVRPKAHGRRMTIGRPFAA